MFVSVLRGEIAELYAQGLPLAEIARRLGVAESTVGFHMEVLCRRPGSDPTPQPPPAAVRQVTTREAVRALLAEGLPRLEIARRLGISKSTVAYHARRLGAPVDARCARRYDWPAIQQYYDLGHSVDACARAFGFSKQTWHAAMKRGEIVPRPHAMPLSVLCAAGVPRNRGHLRLRLVDAGVLEERCVDCGMTQWRGRPAPLQLHHVNGDRHDNRIENLQLLCANCHALTDTYAGRRRAV
jgi:DNA-binding CsgD family transcriptional regulator